MIDWSVIDLERLRYKAAIANSPMFLFDSFFGDGATREIAISEEAGDLVAQFSDIIKSQPLTSDDLLKALVIMTAVAQKNDPNAFSAIEHMALPMGGWLGTCTAVAKERSRRPAFSIHRAPAIRFEGAREGINNTKISNNSWRS